MTDLNVFGWQADQHGCGYYRIQLPMQGLAQLGHGVAYSQRMPPEVRENPDTVIVGQRVCKPNPTVLWQQLAAEGRKLIYEIDDNLWDIDGSSPVAHAFFADPEIRANLQRNIEVSAAVTVTTEPLADVVRQWNPNVHIVPNAVPDWLLDHEPARRDDGLLTIGWGGSATHNMDWAEVADQLKRFLARNSGTEFHCLGNDYAKWMRIPRDRARFTPWVPDVETFLRTIDYHIGVAPLRPHIFNQAKCLDAATRIATRRGVLPISEAQTGDEVWHAGRWLPVLATERQSARPGFLVTTEGGYQIKLTPEHRMLVNGAWMTAGEIKIGDEMAAEPEAAGPLAPARIPWPAESRMSRRAEADHEAWVAATDGPKIDITPRWGRLLGAYLGDGSVGQSTQIQISCDGQDQDWIDLLMDDFRACGLSPSTEKITMFDGTVLRRRAIRVASAHLVRVLTHLGVARPRTNGLPIRVTKVPEVIWRSPRDVIAEFVAGYFEADGHCTQTGVGAVSKDEQLIRDMQRLLLLFAIESRVCPRQHRAQNGHSGIYWHLTLRRAATDVFAKEIGFRSVRKSGRLTEIVSKPHSNAYRPMAWKQRVVSVEPCLVEPVDIQVEGEVFSAAGLVSHNSALKAIECGALGIPIVASAVRPYEDYVQHGVTGYLVRRDHEWGQHLRALANDPDMRAEMGAAGRRQAAEYTISRMAALWEKAVLG